MSQETTLYQPPGSGVVHMVAIEGAQNVSEDAHHRANEHYLKASPEALQGCNEVRPPPRPPCHNSEGSTSTARLRRGITLPPPPSFYGERSAAATGVASTTAAAVSQCAVSAVPVTAEQMDSNLTGDTARLCDQGLSTQFVSHDTIHSESVSFSSVLIAAGETVPKDQARTPLMSPTSLLNPMTACWTSAVAAQDSSSPHFVGSGLYRQMSKITKNPSVPAAKARGSAQLPFVPVLPPPPLTREGVVDTREHAGGSVAPHTTIAGGGLALVAAPITKPARTIVSGGSLCTVPQRELCAQPRHGPCTEMAPPHLRNGTRDGSCDTRRSTTAVIALCPQRPPCTAVDALDISLFSSSPRSVSQRGEQPSVGDQVTLAGSPDSKEPPLLDITQVPFPALLLPSETSVTTSATSDTRSHLGKDEGALNLSFRKKMTPKHGALVRPQPEKLTRNAFVSESPCESSLHCCATARAAESAVVVVAQQGQQPTAQKEDHLRVSSPIDGSTSGVVVNTTSSLPLLVAVCRSSTTDVPSSQSTTLSEKGLPVPAGLPSPKANVPLKPLSAPSGARGLQPLGAAPCRRRSDNTDASPTASGCTSILDYSTSTSVKPLGVRKPSRDGTEAWLPARSISEEFLMDATQSVSGEPPAATVAVEPARDPAPLQATSSESTVSTTSVLCPLGDGQRETTARFTGPSIVAQEDCLHCFYHNKALASVTKTSEGLRACCTLASPEGASLQGMRGPSDQGIPSSCSGSLDKIVCSAVEAIGSVEGRDIAKARRSLSPEKNIYRDDVRCMINSNATPLTRKADVMMDTSAHGGGCVMQEGGDGAMLAQPISGDGLYRRPTRQTHCSCSIGAAPLWACCRPRGGSPMPLVSTSAPPSSILPYSLPCTTLPCTSAVTSDAQGSRGVGAANVLQPLAVQHEVAAQTRASITAASSENAVSCVHICPPPTLTGPSSVQLHCHATPAETEAVASQLPLPTDASPALLSVKHQPRSETSCKLCAARMGAQLPHPLCSVVVASPMPKSLHAAPTVCDIPAVPAAMGFGRPERATRGAVICAHPIVASPFLSFTSQTTTSRGELVVPDPLPIGGNDGAAHVAPPYIPVAASHPPRSDAPPPVEATTTRDDVCSPSALREFSLMNTRVHAVAAVLDASASNHTREGEAGKLRSPRHRPIFCGSGGGVRGAALTVSAASAASVSPVADITHRGVAHATLCSLVCTTSSSRSPRHSASPAAFLAVSVPGAPVPAPSFTSCEKRGPPCRLLSRGCASARGSSPPIITSAISTATNDVSSAEAMMPTGSSASRIFSPQAVSVVSSTSVRRTERAEGLKVAAGANAGHLPTTNTACVTAAAVQVQELRRGTVSCFQMCGGGCSATTEAFVKGRHARDTSPGVNVSHRDHWAIRAVSHSKGNHDTVAVVEALQASLFSEMIDTPDRSPEHHTASLRRSQTRPTHRRAYRGEVSAAVMSMSGFPESFNEAATLPAHSPTTATLSRSGAQAIKATVTGTNRTSLPLFPSWKKKRSRLVGCASSSASMSTPVAGGMSSPPPVPAVACDVPHAVFEGIPTPPSLLSLQEFAPLNMCCTHPSISPVAPCLSSGSLASLGRLSPRHTPDQGGGRTHRRCISGATCTSPTHNSYAQQLTCNSVAASRPHQGQVVWEVLTDVRSSVCKWPSATSSCPSSVTSNVLHQHHQHTACRSGLSRSLSVSPVTPYSTPMMLPRPMRWPTLPASFSSDFDCHSRLAADCHNEGPGEPALPRELPDTPRVPPCISTWQQTRPSLTSCQGGGSSGNQQSHTHTTHAGDFLAGSHTKLAKLPSIGHTAAPCYHRDCFCPVHHTVPTSVCCASGGTGAQGTANFGIPLAPSSQRTRTWCCVTTPGRAGGGAGASTYLGTTSECAIAGQPLHRFASAASGSPSEVVHTAESVPGAKLCAQAALKGVAEDHRAYPCTGQSRSVARGRPQLSKVSASEPSENACPVSSQKSWKGEVLPWTGCATAFGLMPVERGGLPHIGAAAAAAAARSPSRSVFRPQGNGPPLHRGQESSSAALHNVGGGNGGGDTGRVPRLTRALLNQLQQSYTATSAEASRVPSAPTNLFLTKVTVKDWLDATQYSVHGTENSIGYPSVPQRPQLQTMSHGRVGDDASVNPRITNEGAVARSNMAVDSSLTRQLHATADAAPVGTHAGQVILQPYRTSVSRQEPMHTQSPIIPHHFFAVPPPVVMEGRCGAVNRVPNPQILPSRVSVEQEHLQNICHDAAEHSGFDTTVNQGVGTVRSAPTPAPPEVSAHANTPTNSPPPGLRGDLEIPVLTVITIVPPTERRASRSSGDQRGRASSDYGTETAVEMCPKKKSSWRRVIKSFRWRLGGR